MVAICIQAFLNDVLVVVVVHIFMLRKCCVNIYYILHSLIPFPFEFEFNLVFFVHDNISVCFNLPGEIRV